VAQPAIPGLLYATSADGVLRSDDAGVSWSTVGRGVVGWVYSLALDPRDPDALFAGTRDSGVFLSRDRGSTWDRVSEGLDGHPIVGLTLDPVNGNTAYAVVDGLGIAVLDRPN